LYCVVLLARHDAAPDQIAREIAGSDATEAGHPCLEPMVIGIDVLDVENTRANTRPRTVADDLVGNAA